MNSTSNHSSQPLQTVYVSNLVPSVSYAIPAANAQALTVSEKPEKTSSNTPHRHWQSNICDCCVDCKSCCKAFCCPCCAFYTIAGHTEMESNCCKSLCCCLCPCSVFIRAPYRKKLRIKYNLPAKPCNDCCTAFWCPCCALAQELREIKSLKHQGPLPQNMQ